MEIKVEFGWDPGYGQNIMGEIWLNDDDIYIPNNMKYEYYNIKSFLKKKGIEKIKKVYPEFDPQSSFMFVQLTKLNAHDLTVIDSNKRIKDFSEIRNNLEIDNDLLKRRGYKEHHSKGFGDFGEYYSYSHSYYSSIYDEELMVCFKTPLNPHADYWDLIIDNDLFEEIAKIRVRTIKDVNQIFEIVGINQI